MTKYLSLILILMSMAGFSQQDANENYSKIATVLESYFDLEREAIHLHVDKTTFLNNEAIWYQGYIINRKANKPYFTTNVFVALYDEKGTQISEKLVYGTSGVFSGKIDLDPKLASGNYYIQVFTNWMNNFSENESTITKISIIHPEEGIRNYKKLNPESLEILLHPEGKNLVRDVFNTIGIRVSDCRGNSPENLEAVIKKSSGEIIKTIKLNQFGYGRFDIVPAGESIRVAVKHEEKTIEKTLPDADPIGLSIEANTFSIENKTAIKIKTNKSSLDAFRSKKLHLIIHQDQKVLGFPVEFKPDALEQTIIVNNSQLQAGINTVRIIDSDLKQWSERLIYIQPAIKSNINILKNHRTGDKINLVGYTDKPNSIMSISVLPEDTKSAAESTTIVSGILVNPYLNKPLDNSSYYLNSPNRMKYYELDLVLLNEENSKYNWDLMKLNPPKPNYSFDVGLDLKGKVDASIKDKAYHKIKMVAYKDRIMASADVNENGDYELKHLLLTDSALVKLSLEKLPDFTNVQSNLNPKVMNRNRVFNKPILNYIAQSCNDNPSYEALSDTELPKFVGKIIKLDEVVVKQKTIPLTRSRMLSNAMLRGYKIDETNNHGTLLNFIEANGFVVRRNMGDVYITIRQRMSLNSANPTPLISVDDRILFSSFNELDIMQMTEIDEIYISAHTMSASMNNNVGTIRIYTKKPQNNIFGKPDPNSFFVKKAYSVNYPFKNPDYQNTQSKGFDNYGIIGWSALTRTSDSGDFLFDITDYSKSKCRVIIEGMTAEGELYHEEKTIDLK